MKEHFTSSGSSVRARDRLPKLPPHLAALRPRQWTKNLVVFAAPLFAFQIDLQTIVSSVLTFILFCCVSSCFYLINDIADVESDRQHPLKCKRPIAAGLVSIPVAMAMAVSLLLGSLVVAWHHSPSLAGVIFAYAVLQITYNLKLKHTVILDIVAIATGFILRALAGAVATNVVISEWFLLCTAMLALFLGIEKRKAELRLLEIKGGKTRKVLQRYSIELLNRMESVVTTSVVIAYALWSSGPKVNGASTPWMFVTLPFVIYGIFRYQLLSDPRNKLEEGDSPDASKRSERPEEILLTDFPILLTVTSWITAVLAILLLERQGWFI